MGSFKKEFESPPPPLECSANVGAQEDRQDRGDGVSCANNSPVGVKRRSPSSTVAVVQGDDGGIGDAASSATTSASCGLLILDTGTVLGLGPTKASANSPSQKLQRTWGAMLAGSKRIARIAILCLYHNNCN